MAAIRPYTKIARMAAGIRRLFEMGADIEMSSYQESRAAQSAACTITVCASFRWRCAWPSPLSHGLAASSFDDHMTKGRAAIAGGDFSAAEREYRAARREVRRASEICGCSWLTRALGYRGTAARCACRRAILTGRVGGASAGWHRPGGRIAGVTRPQAVLL